MPKAEGADLHEAVGEDGLEEPAEQRDGGEGGGTLSSATGFAGGEGDAAVLERDDAALGDGDLEDREGEICARGMAVRIGLAVDSAGAVPDVWGDVLQQAGLAHSFFEFGKTCG
jgi:hypothetical protein